MQDCWVEIISFLSLKEIVSVSLVNKFLSAISKKDVIWEMLCRKDFEFLPDILNITWKKLYEMQYVTIKFNSTRARLFECRNFNPDMKDRDKDIEVEMEKDLDIWRYEHLEKEPDGNYSLIREHVPEGVGIKRGDLVCPHINNERKKFMFDGKKLVKFGYKVIKEFPIRYWQSLHVIDQVKFNPAPYLNEISGNIKFYVPIYKRTISLDEIKEEEFFIRSSFIYNHFTYFVFVGPFFRRGRYDDEKLSKFLLYNSRRRYSSGRFRIGHFNPEQGWDKTEERKYEDRSLFC